MRRGGRDRLQTPTIVLVLRRPPKQNCIPAPPLSDSCEIRCLEAALFASEQQLSNVGGAPCKNSRHDTYLSMRVTLCNEVRWRSFLSLPAPPSFRCSCVPSGAFKVSSPAFGVKHHRLTLESSVQRAARARVILRRSSCPEERQLFLGRPIQTRTCSMCHSRNR